MVAYKWISTYGGPYICTTPAQAALWRGIEGESLPFASPRYQGFNLDNLLLGFEHTDYGWTTVIRTNCLFFLPGQINDIIVIRDYPGDITFHQTGPNQFFIIIWVGADSKEQVHLLIPTHTKLEYESLDCAVVFSESEAIAIDSSTTVAESNDNILHIDILPGSYNLGRTVFQQEDSVILHALMFTREGTQNA